MYPIDAILIINCLYLPFLITLSVVELWLILRPGSQFKSSFYSLFVASVIVDLIFFATTVYEFRFSLFPLVNGIFDGYDCGLCSKIRVTLSFVCPFTQDLLNCFIALNRFTSIYRPIQHSSIWKRLLPFSICFSYFVSIAIFT
ncbi:hypothetical protein PFISCL1PPCAC_14539, partial [Pristionchus fissidentatus]